MSIPVSWVRMFAVRNATACSPRKCVDVPNGTNRARTGIARWGELVGTRKTMTGHHAGADIATMRKMTTMTMTGRAAAAVGLATMTMSGTMMTVQKV
jgi:hypothetical protein